jgi:hypothetical protein
LQYRNASADASIIIPSIIGGLGIILTGGIGGLSAQVALASLRIATTTLYIGATRGAAVGTGYVVLQGGKLVVQKARPGVISTIRTANRAARDARASLQAASQATTNARGAIQIRVLEGGQIVAEAGTAARESVVNGANGISNQLIKLLPNYSILVDPRVTMQGQSRIRLVVEGEQDAQMEADTNGSDDLFVFHEREDGVLELRNISRDRTLGNHSQGAEPTVAGPSTIPYGFEIIDTGDIPSLDGPQDLDIEDEEGFVGIAL